MTDGSVTEPTLDRARSALDRREWRDAFDAFAALDADGSLGPTDLEGFARAAFLVGSADAYVGALERAHQGHVEAGDTAAAALCAVWIGLHLAEHGEMARASGWFQRAGRVLEGHGEDGAARGWLLVPAAMRAFMGGDYDAAHDEAGRAAALGERFGDRDLAALARHIQGRVLVRQARVPEGLALLDEAMIAVASDQLSPQVTGLIYCSVIAACRNVWALGRAQEWTEALSAWCDRQPDMVAYTGECRLFRSEILELRGEWTDALAEARRAHDRFLAGSEPTSSGLALYRQGELHRLRGSLDEAEEAFRAASHAGREPMPGLALLRLAQGDAEAAAAASRRAVAEARGPAVLARLLPAHVEIMLAVQDIDEARRAAARLREVADALDSGVIRAAAGHALGAVALAANRPAEALAPLREAFDAWRTVDAPYHAARTRELVGRACRALGDHDTADLELEAARTAYERLRADPDLERLDRLSGRRRRPAADHGLTPREREVLALVATGMTNRAVGDRLFISEKTVARHVANIFAKLGLSTRAAATAFAYENGLVEPDSGRA